MMSMLLPTKFRTTTESELAARRAANEERINDYERLRRSELSARQELAALKLKIKVFEAKAKAYDQISPQPASTALPCDGGRVLAPRHLMQVDQHNPVREVLNSVEAAGINVDGAWLYFEVMENCLDRAVGVLELIEGQCKDASMRGVDVASKV
ncbi:hypothetical protein NFC81_09015 [Salinispirillum sp. LH 10-3-1]|uniref:Uncharacterized protein n=1 Tax=Salinispirillum sp. LH 10-3-1 TaxID=2952525 RepID=A0AB38YBX1_9GAMM